MWSSHGVIVERFVDADAAASVSARQVLRYSIHQHRRLAGPPGDFRFASSMRCKRSGGKNSNSLGRSMPSEGGDGAGCPSLDPLKDAPPSWSAAVRVAGAEQLALHRRPGEDDIELSMARRCRPWIQSGVRDTGSRCKCSTLAVWHMLPAAAPPPCAQPAHCLRRAARVR